MGAHTTPEEEQVRMAICRQVLVKYHELRGNPAAFLCWLESEAFRRIGSIQIMEYACHDCGRHAIEVTAHQDHFRQWECACGNQWRGGKRDLNQDWQDIAERLESCHERS